jgi:hypothetical protein
MFTLVAYSQDLDTSNVLRYINPVADPHVRVEAPNVIVPSVMNHLLGVYCFGASVTGCRIETPALRRTLLYDATQVRAGTVITYPPHLNDLFYSPLTLDEAEPMRAMVSKSATMSERNTVLVWLGDGPQTTVSGEIFTIVGTWGGALTSWEWGNRALTFSQTLPAGYYQVVGMSAVHAPPVAARLVFVGGTWRPGVIARSSIGDLDIPVFRRGALGVWGEFRHDQPPTVDVLAAGASSTGTVFLDVIKVG